MPQPTPSMLEFCAAVLTEVSGLVILCSTLLTLFSLNCYRSGYDSFTGSRDRLGRSTRRRLGSSNRWLYGRWWRERRSRRYCGFLFRSLRLLRGRLGHLLSCDYFRLNISPLSQILLRKIVLFDCGDTLVALVHTYSLCGALHIKNHNRVNRFSASGTMGTISLFMASAVLTNNVAKTWYSDNRLHSWLVRELVGDLGVSVC